MMRQVDGIEDRLRRLLVALERLDSTWRREHALTANEKLVVAFLAADGALAPTELSELVGITTAGISTLLDRLEADGYVIRRRNPTDGRRVLVTLTKKALRARMGFESVTAEIARAAQADEEAAIAAFLERAERIALRRAGVDPGE
ncbi:MAG: putative transcriptional regulator, MarR-family [Thermoleophilia bacterium]|nr:putative transcriptional regulator, MarR-family [Thermoleophilia bacterium]MCZ4496045.1 putative transcriptional regulator, MarR-family [Thermoleophilia bacterium]